jgi:predicted ribonuclease toxin of YeeF-YezG toxin-antitoxin module
VGNFGSGAFIAGKEAVSGIVEMGCHPIITAKNLGNALAHPIITGGAIYDSIEETFEKDVVYGDSDSRAKFAGKAVGGIGTAIIGAKGLDKVSKIVKGSKGASSAAKKAGNVAGGTRKTYSNKGVLVIPKLVLVLPTIPMGK